jgi:RNA polymerase sigma factor (sigma-70 family)
MTESTQAEQYLVERIRKGDDRAWSQVVERYHGRLLAFAQRQLGQRADAEDAVQDTFVNFIRAIGAFRAQCGLESYLFTILRRKIIDIYRRGEGKKVGLIQDLYKSQPGWEDSSPMAGFASAEPTASWYLRRDERKEVLLDGFAAALIRVLDHMKQSLNFEAIKTIELLFFCQLSNSDTAQVLKIDPSRVGVIKHRCIKQIQEGLSGTEGPDLSEGDWEGILKRIWQEYRPSCPKRNTIGAYLLGTLEKDWQEYVAFHLDVLGCHFCRANFEDLQEQNRRKGADKLQQRILESTVGFLPAGR